MEETLGIDMSPPFTVTKTLNYVGYLLEERQCCSKTVNQYLSGIRMWHLAQGMDVSSLRPVIVSLILKGREHWENVESTLKRKPKRVAVTLSVMKYLKRVIREESWQDEKKLRITIQCQSQST